MAWDWSDPIGSAWETIKQTGGNLLEGLGGLILNDDGSLNTDYLLPLLIGGYGTSQGWFDTQQPNVGYQGTIPRYTAVRRRVGPTDYDQTRRPGSAGRYYFSPTNYAPEGEEATAVQNAQNQATLRQAANQQNLEYLFPQALGLANQYTQYRAPVYEPSNPDYQPPAWTQPTGGTTYPAPPPGTQGGVDIVGQQGPPMAPQAPPPAAVQPPPDTHAGLPALLQRARGSRAAYEAMTPQETGRFSVAKNLGYTGGGTGLRVGFNRGGLADMGDFIQGPGDGMSDSIPAAIAGRTPAALGDGEFVVPADVVSHLGNGSSNAGAQRLQEMMARVRQARTGRPVQGRQINPNKMMPR